METISRDYSPKGVEFYFIYKALAHPETNGYVTPFAQEERLMHVEEAERRLRCSIPWLCDTMANDAKHVLGDAPNSEFVIDPRGVVVRRRAWSNPKQLRSDLEELVGPVDPITQVAEPDLKTVPPPKAAASGVVPRLKLTGRFEAVQVKPVDSQQPFYAKLRAEADESLLRTGRGKLYLGFLLDPLYGVHWNNLAAPLRFTIHAPDAVTVSPASGTGPKVEAEADIDPREFTIDVESDGKLDQPLRLKVDYFACHDEEGWCKPISQEYVIQVDRDPDGGWVQSRRRAGQRNVGRKPGKAKAE